MKPDLKKVSDADLRAELDRRTTDRAQADEDTMLEDSRAACKDYKVYAVVVGQTIFTLARNPKEAEKNIEDMDWEYDVVEYSSSSYDVDSITEVTTIKGLDDYQSVWVPSLQLTDDLETLFCDLDARTLVPGLNELRKGKKK